MSTITAIGTALPKYKHRQSDICEFMADLYPATEKEKQRLRLLYRKSGIDTRYSVVPDYSTALEKRELYPKTKNLEPFPSLEQRMVLFHNNAEKLASQAVKNCLGNISPKEITHLITVSCTGMAAPGLDIELVKLLGLNTAIYRTSINFMGCYAAMHALKQADMICKTTANAVVAVVCVELCTLHFQKSFDSDNIFANLLFSDGAAAAIVQPDSNNYKGLKIKGFYSDIDADGVSDMAWQLSGKGFLMTLSAYVPSLIKKGFKKLTDNALKQANIEYTAIDRFAVHPGGKKILDVIGEELNLNNGELNESKKVLREYGNMSSATILFVLKEMLENKIVPGKSETIFGAAFGPGLTLETVLLENIND